MPENASVFQRPQIAVESVAGTAPATGYKRLMTMGIEPAPASNVEDFKPAGYKFSTVTALGKFWTTAKLSGQPTFNEIVYPLSSVLNTATITTLTGTARNWAFQMSTANRDTPVTFTVESGSDTRAMRFSNGIVDGMGLQFSRSQIKMSGDMIGQGFLDHKVRWIQMVGATGGTFTITCGANTTSAIAYNATNNAIQTALEGLASVGAGNVLVSGGPINTAPIVLQFRSALDLVESPVTSVSGASLTGTTPTLTISNLEPTASATTIIPILPTQTSIYMADSWAGLPGTALDRVISADWAISGRYSPVWPINAAYPSFAATVEATPKMELKVKQAVDAAGMSNLNYLKAGTKRFIRIESVGAIIAGSDAYRLRLDMCGLATDISDFSDEDGLYAVEYTFLGTHDETWGRAVEIDVINSLAAL